MDKRIEGETREKEKYTRERIQVRESTVLVCVKYA